MDGVDKVVLYLRVRAWFAILHQACQPLQSVVDRLVNVMSLVENRSNRDRIHSPLHPIVIVLVHDSLQEMKRTHGFSLVVIANFVIPLHFSFVSDVVLQLGDADVSEAINLPED